MPEYQNFYFTYGTDPRFPFFRGFSVIIAPSQEAACAIFRQYHPCRTGSTALNCAWIYSEKAFLETGTASGKYSEEFCHEVIGPADQCCRFLAEHPQYLPNTEGRDEDDILNKIRKAFLCRTPTNPGRTRSDATLCPNCNRFLDRHEQRHGNIDIPYCKWCGQAIDWRTDGDPR